MMEKNLNWEAFSKKAELESRWASGDFSYEEASKEIKSLVREMSNYSLDDTIPVLSALLTVPEYQSVCIVLEHMICLAALHCRGSKKITTGKVSKWFRQVRQSKCAHGVDPAVDLFSSLVFDHSGNYKIIEGTWEGTTFGAQCFLDAVTGVTESGFQDTQAFAYSMLALSNEICERAGLSEHVLGSTTVHENLNGSSIGNLEQLKSRVIFDVDFLLSLGFTRKSLASISVSISDLDIIGNQTPGYTVLEERPLVKLSDNTFVVSLPTAIGQSMQHHILEMVHKVGGFGLLDQSLKTSLTNRILDTRFLGSIQLPALEWRTIENIIYAGVDVLFDVGHISHFSFCLPTSEELYKKNRKEVLQFSNQSQATFEYILNAPPPDDITVKASHKFVFFFCFGRSLYLDLPKSERRHHFFDCVQMHNAVRLSDLSNVFLQDFFKTRVAVHAAREAGVEVRSIGGLLEEFAWVRKNEGHVIPHETLLEESSNPTSHLVLWIPFNSCRDLYYESLLQTSRHQAFSPTGQSHLLRRVENSSKEVWDQRHLLFASMDGLDAGQLIARYEGMPEVWISATFHPNTNRGTQYRLWEMAIYWVSRIASTVSAELDLFIANTPMSLLFEFADDFGGDEQIEAVTEAEIESLSVLTVDSSSFTYVLTFLNGFKNGFAMASNIAEKIIVSQIMQAIVEHTRIEITDEKFREYVDIIMQNDDARHFHIMYGTTFIDLVREFQPRGHIEVQNIDDAILKLEMSSNVKSKGSLVSGLKKCTELLNSTVKSLLSILIEDLGKHSRTEIIRRVYANIDKAYSEVNWWEKTAAAVIGLYQETENGVSDVVNIKSKYAHATISGRILIEIACCEAPVEGSEELSDLDIERYLTIASLIFRYGGLSDAIRYNALKAELHVSPYGDILFRDDFGDLVVQPTVGTLIEQNYRKFASNRDINYRPPRDEEDEIDGSIDKDYAKAWYEETGFHFANGLRSLTAIENYALELESTVISVQSKTLIDLIVADGVPESEAKCFIEYFTLPIRSSWRSVPEGYSARDIDPWRYGRRLSLTAKPLVPVDMTEEAELIVAPISLQHSYRMITHNSYYGVGNMNFFTSNEMIRGWWQKASSGHDHSQAVAERLLKLGWKTRNEIKLTTILNMKLEKDFGDIDVLAWNEELNEIWLIECKDLGPARTYSEIAHMLSEYQGSLNEKGKPDKLKKHLIRCDKLVENKERLANYCDLPMPVIKMGLIFSTVVPMQYAKIEPLKDAFTGSIDEFETYLGQKS